MKINRYFILVILAFVFCNSYAQQHNGKNIKNALPPNSKQTLAVTTAQSYSNIPAKLRSFMLKVGVNPASAKLYSTNSALAKAVSTNVGAKITLPSQLDLNNDRINRILLDKQFGTPRLIDMNPVPLQKGKVLQSTAEASDIALNFLKENKSLLKISDPQNEFKLESAAKDGLGMIHVRYEQIYKGLEVWGKEVYIHLDNQGNVSSLTGRFASTPVSIRDLSINITSSNAISTAINDLKSRSSIINLPDQLESILKYHGPSAREIIWYDKQSQPHLAWYVEVRSGLSQDWYYFIDAKNGSILNSYNNVCFDGNKTGTGTDLNGVSRTFGTYQVGTTYYMLDGSQPMFNSAQSQIPGNPVGAIQTLDLQNTDLTSSSRYYYVTSTNNQWPDQVSVSAHYNAITTYNYFRTVQNRNSIDDKGMNIYSIIHVTENNQPMENAFWSGTVMCYGDGGTYFKPLAGGLDVAAHEMTHGVTQNTSNLEYQDQSGALNESMSDVFGKLVDTTSWQIGPTVVKDRTIFPSGALRDMSNPHNGGSSSSDQCWQPANMSEFVNTTQDNGGVHVNSGIPNYAFYFAASSIGRPDAGKIWYRTETNYLTHSSQFLDARIATEKAAADLFGSSSNQLNAVKSAWDNVGVLEAAPPPPPPPSELTGTNWILATNTDPTDSNSIYMMKTVIQSTSDYSPLTQTPVLTRPAVTDTSGFILFVDKNNNLRAIFADPNNPQETVIDSSGYWWSVSIGPGLNSFATTSKYIDTTIYYFDLVNNTAKEFKIKTPSYDAADTKTALYADALSFDPTGQFLMFDTFNQMQSSTGDTLSFWNINLLDVKSGNMESVFAPQAKGTSIGDPSFSKTSQTRFTFDYWNSTNNTYKVFAADFNTGKSALVASTTALGYPSYSGDDKTIVYHNKSAGHDVLWQMPLQSDFITGTGTYSTYVQDATYPVWFVIGSRITGVKNEPGTIPQTISLEQNYPNPFNPSTTISYSINKPELVSLKVYDVLGNEITTLVNKMQSSGSYKVQFTMDGKAAVNKQLSSGIYFYQLKAGDFIQTKKMY